MSTDDSDVNGALPLDATFGYNLSMNDAQLEVIEKLAKAHDAFSVVRCCGQVVGLANSRPFTVEAGDRVQAICDRLGDAWATDPEARRLLDDPISYAAPADGVLVPFSCPACSASFVWVDGAPMKVTGA